jgi:hypothetical protein
MYIVITCENVYVVSWNISSELSIWYISESVLC